MAFSYMRSSKYVPNFSFVNKYARSVRRLIDVASRADLQTLIARDSMRKWRNAWAPSVDRPNSGRAAHLYKRLAFHFHRNQFPNSVYSIFISRQKLNAMAYQFEKVHFALHQLFFCVISFKYLPQFQLEHIFHCVHGIPTDFHHRLQRRTWFSKLETIPSSNIWWKNWKF